MKNEETTVVARFNNPYDAYIVKGRLEADGIIAGVIEDTTANTLMGNQSNGAVRVIVFERDLPRARHLLATPSLEEGEVNGQDEQAAEQ